MATEEVATGATGATGVTGVTGATGVTGVTGAIEEVLTGAIEEAVLVKVDLEKNEFTKVDLIKKKH